METIQIAKEVISKLQESFDKETRDDIAKSFLKIVADKFGTEFILTFVKNFLIHLVISMCYFCFTL